jgi:hypothetical protein
MDRRCYFTVYASGNEELWMMVNAYQLNMITLPWNA